MAGTGGIKAGQAFVELYLKNNVPRGLKRAQRQIKGFGAGLAGIGGAITAPASLAAGPLAFAVKTYADFEQQMANVSTMVGDQSGLMDTYRAGVRRMAVETGEGTDTLAAGLYDILSASVPPTQALEVLGVAARSAKAGLTDTGTSADAITTILNAYGVEANRAGDVSDLLFSIVKRGKTTFGQLAPVVGNVATTAAAAGVPLEELGAMIANLTRNGIKTEEAVTATNAVIASFLKPSAEAADTARSLGFEMSAATLQSEGLAGVFEKLEGLDPETLSKLFPNVRALKGVLPAIASMESFGEDLDAMGDRAGATEEAYRKMARTMATQFARAKQAALIALSQIGEAVAEPVGRAVSGFVRISKAVADFVSKNKPLVLGVAKGIALVTALGVVIGAVGVGFMLLGSAVGGLATVLGIVGTGLSAVLGLLGAIASPIGLVIAAVVGLGSAWLTMSGAGSKALGWLLERFHQFRVGVGQVLSGIGQALAGGDIALAARVLWVYLRTQWLSGVTALEGIWLGMKDTLLRSWVSLQTGLASFFLKTWAGIRSAWINVTAFLERLWLNLTNGIRNIWDSTVGFVTDAFLKMRGLLDEDFDAEAAVTIRREEADADRRRRDETRDAALAASDAERDRQLAVVGREERDGLDQLDRQAVARNAERRSRYEARYDEAAADLAAARQEYDDALVEAKVAGERARIDGGGPDQAENGLQELAAKLQEGLDAAVNVTKETVTAGTFNPAAILSLQGTSPYEQRTAEAAEETARNTKRLLTEGRANVAL
ncbi:MAG: phage tail tape measure protein [Planctomycetota bacterium]